MVRGVKFFTYIAAGLLLILSLAVTSCELGLFDTVKKEVEDYYADLAGSPKIVVKKGIWDVPDGGDLDIGLADPLGISAKTIILTIENPGTGELNLTGNPRVNLDNFTDFDILSLPPSVIGAGQNAIFTLEFAPGGFGSKTTQVIIANDASPDGSYTFTLSGTGATPGPQLELRQGASTVIAVDDPFNAGGTAPNTTLSTVFTISNIGTPGSMLDITSPVTVTDVGLTGFYTLIQPAETSLGEGVSTDFTVEYTPTSKTKDIHTETVTIANNAVPTSFQFTISAGVLYSDIFIKQGATVLPDGTGSYNFVVPVMADGNNETAGSYVDFTIENLGTVDLTVSNIQLSGTDPSDFDRSGSTTATVQPSGTPATFSIRFDPLTLGMGNKTATVNIANNDPDTSKSTYNFDVTGTATKAPKIYFSQYDPAGLIYRANLNGSNMEKVGGPFVSAGQVALDTTNEIIYVATAKGIFSISYDGSVTPFIEAEGVAGLALDLTNGLIYWTENTAKYGGRIGIAVLASPTPNYVVGMEPGFRHLALDTANKLIYVAHQAGAILVYDYTGANVRKINAPDPYGLALDLANNLIYYTGYSDGAIYWVRTGGGTSEKLVGDTKGVAGIALDLNDEAVYWSNTDDGYIKRALITNPKPEILKTERMRCFGIALDLVP